MPKPYKKPLAKDGTHRGSNSIYPDKRDIVLEHLRVGHTDIDACIMSGISHHAFYDWIKKHDDFAEDVKKARLTAKDQCVKIVRKAALKTWQAAAWYLERRFRNEYAMKQFVEHNGKVVSLTEKAEKTAKKYEE